jgi:hypothetical protein
MNKESLIKVREKIISILQSDNDINLIDKTELMINLNGFLDPQEYEKNIKVLRIEKEREK